MTIFFILCSTIGFSQSIEKIEIARGPEDIVLDGNHLIIACSERRKEKPFTSGIWRLNLDNEQVSQYKIVLKIERKFDPLGIGLLHTDEQNYLFVTNHIVQKKKAEIICFRIDSNQLIEIKAYRHPMIQYPNSVVALSLEEFYFTNSLIFRGNVVHYQNGKYQVIAKSIPLANGLCTVNEHLFVTSTLGNKLIKLSPNGDMFKKETILKLKGPDNIEFLSKNKVLVACHTNRNKFLRYFYNEKRFSPFTIYEVDLKNRTKTVVFEDDGQVMSAGSSAVFYGNDLYVGQIYGGFLLSVKK